MVDVMLEPRITKVAFYTHRASARQRGIPFRLTFGQWLGIWKRSGRLSRRGCRTGQYVMARFGDQGAYEVGNVRIVTAYQNNVERNILYDYNRAVTTLPRPRAWVENQAATLRGRPKSAAHRAKLSAALMGRQRLSTSPEWCANLSAALRGKPKSAAARKAMSLAKKGRRWFTDGARSVLTYNPPPGYRPGRAAW